MPWFAIKLLGLPRWVWAAAAIVLIIAGGLLWAKLAEDADDKANQEIGATKAVNAGQEAVLSQVERANEAEAAINRGGDAERHARCLRYATPDTRANCDALLPVPY